MTAPTKVIEVDVDSTDPIGNLVHTVCHVCIAAERTPLIALCGHDVSDDVMVDALDYGPDECSMCAHACAHHHCCPMCGRKANT